MELLAEGRTAEVFALDEARVVKLDRMEWNGLSTFEAGIVGSVHAAGLPVPAVHDTVVIEGRHGVVLERLDGPTLWEVLRGPCDVEAVAGSFVELLGRIHAAKVPGVSGLHDRLDHEIERSGLQHSVRAELRHILDVLCTDVIEGLCHFDFHPRNIIVTGIGWHVIDWLTAAHGPAAADLARSLVLMDDFDGPVAKRFIVAVRGAASAQHDLDEAALGEWTRIVAAARLAEGFTGTVADRLASIATGDATLI
jgi:Ser/Thr protein kinase RdoA (MazF antagonist)